MSNEAFNIKNHTIIFLINNPVVVLLSIIYYS